MTQSLTWRPFVRFSMISGSSTHDPQSPLNEGERYYSVGDLRIDIGRQRVTRGEDEIALPRLSFELLVVLARAAPDLVSNRQLMEQLWPVSVVNPETLNQRVKLLRDALNDDAHNPRYIGGLRGRGYRLLQPVEVQPSKSARETVATGDAPDIAPSPDFPTRASEGIAERPTGSPPASPGAKHRLRMSRSTVSFSLWFLSLATTLIGATWVFQTLRREQVHLPEASIEVIAAQPRTVAVLPFETLSSVPGDNYIARGIADAILYRLASVPKLAVISRSSSFALGNSLPDTVQAGRIHGVRYLVEGSVQRQGNRLRVTAYVVDTQTNRAIWSLQLARQVDSLFELQDQIAQQVAHEISVISH